MCERNLNKMVRTVETSIVTANIPFLYIATISGELRSIKLSHKLLYRWIKKIVLQLGSNKNSL